MAKKNLKTAEASVSNSLVTRDIFDTAFFGTKLRTSFAVYIVAAIAILSFFLPFTVDTAQSRNVNQTDGNSYSSEISDMKWNDAISTGFDIAVGKKVPYVKSSTQQYRISLPLTPDAFVEGYNVKDTYLYLSYGDLLAVVIPLIAIYAIILMACRSQWQKGGAFIAVGVASIAAIALHIYVVYKLAADYTASEVGAKTLSKRISDIIPKLGVGFYISIIAFVAILVFCVAGFIALKAGKGYPMESAKRLETATADVAEVAEATEEVAAEAVEEAAVEAAEAVAE